MRIAHLSDLHLGHRAFSRMERGWNLRERDLAGAFHGVIQELGRLSPDLVLLAGDLFDRPDPPSTAFLTLTRGIRTLAELLPGVPVLAIAGERDTPLAPADPGPVAVLDALPGVEAASGAPRAVHLRGLDAHVLMVPARSVVGPPFPRLRPDPSARWNILLLRGTPGDRPDGLTIDPGEWDYVALGGAHEAWARPDPGGMVRIAGSLERVGADPWREARIEKGYWLADLERGSADFHSVRGRPIVDLAPVRVSGDAVDDGTRRLRELVEGLPGGIEGKIVRVRLRGGAEGRAAAGVSPGLLAALRRRAAHLEIQAGADDDRIPELLGPGPGPEPPPAEIPRLLWRPDPDSPAAPVEELELAPGVWALVAESPELRVRVAEELAAPPGGRSGGGAMPRLVPNVPDRTRGERASVDPDPQPPGTSRRPLRELRSEWIEAMGDLEAASLEWVRERQEADSRLSAYRDRARELRDRIRELERAGPEAPCPTCHRPLAEAHPGMLAELHEEWESVVQDGKWWKRRRDQLEEQPRTLRELDRHVLELQAELEGMAEGGVRTGDGTGSAESAASLPDFVRNAGSRELELAADLLGRVTEGRLQLLSGGPGGTRVRSIDGEERQVAAGDLPLVEAALRLARAAEDRPPVLLLDEFAAGESGSEVVRLVELIAGVVLAFPVLVVVDPEVAQRLPELFAGRIEMRRDAGGGIALRTVGPGRAEVRLSSAEGELQ